MAHFAKIKNGIVTQIIVIGNNDCDGGNFPQSEPVGQAFIASLLLDGNWKQTSYNSNFRKLYASIGGTYNEQEDVFVSIKPYPSWSLDTNNDWQAPIPKPNDGKMYRWDESSLDWVAIVG